MAAENLSKVTDGVNLEIQTARNSLRQAIEQVNLTRNSLDKACENETMALERYDEGKSSVIEVIDAQTYRQLAQMNYVHAKVSAQNYYSSYSKRSTNTKSSEFIVSLSPMKWTTITYMLLFFRAGTFLLLPDCQLYGFLT